MATILVVDDERLICDLLRAVLSRYGHEVLTATSGREGLELFRQQRPRFTLVDLHMPEMDGIEVLKQIRAVDPQASVIVLTEGGADILEKENQAWELGVTDFLKKGLSLDILVKAMERAMQLPAKSPEPLSPVPEAAGAPPSIQKGEAIMVVDDELLVRDLLTQFLTMRGYRVCAAQDGPTALGLIEQERPKLIVLDMYMPGMNGLEVLRALRAKKYGGGVIALTGSQDEKLLQEVLDLGAVDVMGKPVDLERLALAVQVGCILTES